MRNKLIIAFAIDFLTFIFVYFLYRIGVVIVDSNLCFLLTHLIMFNINYFIWNKYLFKEKLKIKNYTLFCCTYVLFIISKKVVVYLFLNLGILSFNNFFVKNIIKCIAIIICILLIIIIKLLVLKKHKLIGTLFSNIKAKFLRINNTWNRIIKAPVLKQIFKFLPHSLLVFILLIISLFCSFKFLLSNGDPSVYNDNGERKIAGPIIDKKVTIFLSDYKIHDNINVICIPIGTYGRENNSILSFSIVSSDGVKLYYKSINTRKLIDNQNYCIKFRTIKSTETDKYSIIIKATGANKSNHVTIFKNKDTNKYVITIKKHALGLSIKVVALILFILSSLIINYFLNKNNKIKIHHFYLLCLVYIIPIVLIYPPFTVPDEYYHFYQSYGVSQLDNVNSKKELKIPKNIDCLNYSLFQLRDKVNNYDDIKKCNVSSKNIIESKNSVKLKHATPSAYAIGYIFQSSFLKIIDIFTNNPMIIYYIPKLLSSLIMIVFIFKTLKKIPNHKQLLLFIVTIPMFIQQMCSYSYDSTLNLVSILYFGYYIYLLNSKKQVSIYKCIPLILFGIYFAVLKIVYLPLLALLFLLDKKKFNNNIFKKIIMLVIILVIIFAFRSVILKIFTSNGNLLDNKAINQLVYLKSNPFALFNIIVNTIKYKGLFYITSLFAYFGWFRFSFPYFNIVLYIVMFAIIILSDKSCFDNKKYKTFILFLIALSISFICSSMYIYWTNYKDVVVEGVQGRYFIPLLPFLGVALMPKTNKLHLSNYNLYLFINIMLLQYVLYSIIQFY